MRFELSVALKYLIPRRRQLSVSIISLVSILVISLVVWLAIVFMSVTEGIEKKWLEELTTLNAPLRLRPKEAYYSSYYYQIDSVSQKSNYSLKTLGEKLHQTESDPYDPTMDIEIPSSFPSPILNADGTLKDLVKEAHEAIVSLKNYSGFRIGEFEAGLGNLHLSLLRNENETLLTQFSYVVGYDKENSRLDKLFMPPRREDLDHLSSTLVDSRDLKDSMESYLFHSQTIPTGKSLGEGLILPKGFQKSGVLIGDRGHVSFYTPSPSGMQEQRLPIYIAGFYDPGMMPLGNKVVYADPSIPAMLKGNVISTDEFFGNGFAVWLDNIKQADKAKEAIQRILDQRGINTYFKIESYSDYEFSRPLLDQLKSDKNLFTLIAIIILLVACSNIISMLLLLVNDKKKEIGVLQSMGATRGMIISIFGFCGMITGVVSCIVGAAAALFTLHHLQVLVNLLSLVQGRDAFQAAFYGSTLPNTLSMNSLIFVVVSTTLLSFLAGVVPAIKAVKIRPSATLRSE